MQGVASTTRPVLEYVPGLHKKSCCAEQAVKSNITHKIALWMVIMKQNRVMSAGDWTKPMFALHDAGNYCCAA